MARKFRFRLETLCRVRELEQDAQRRCVAAAIGEVHKVEGRMAQLGTQMRDTLDCIRSEKKVGRIEPTSLRTQQQRTELLNRWIEDAQVQLAARQTKLAEEQAKLAEACKKLRVLEKLREKKRESHLREVAREEQKETDEAASQMMLRQSRIVG